MPKEGSKSITIPEWHYEKLEMLADDEKSVFYNRSRAMIVQMLIEGAK
tara:strand:- start:43 stop:186 length:144 start_codon:yes stop_codon:yes gene_type:complete